MRIAAISDIHGNLPALRAVLQDIEHSGADLIVNLGDILSGPLWPAETAELLMSMDLPTIAGNHERQVLTQTPERMGATDAYTAQCLAESHRAWMAGLPAARWLDDRVFCCHGTPDSDLHYFLETVTPDFRQAGSPGMRQANDDEVRERLDGCRAALVLCGHTHMPRVFAAGETLIVNPGSVGLQAYDDTHPHPHVLEVGSPHARWALIEQGESAWSVQLRCVPYDWEAAACQAERNGRADWAHALRSGRVGRWEAAA